MASRIPNTILVLLAYVFLPSLSLGQSVYTNLSFLVGGTNFTIDCGGYGNTSSIRSSPFPGYDYLWPDGDSVYHFWPELSNPRNTKEWSVLNVVSLQPRPIRGASSNEWFVYNTNRFAVSGFKRKWGYRFPVRHPGLYSCSAQFAELYPSVKPGERVFDLEINAERGSRSFKSIDVKAVVPDFTVLTKTAPTLAVTRYIEVFVQTNPNSKHGAIINGISCQRTGNLPTDIAPFQQPKVDRQKISTVPVIQSTRITDRVVNGSEVNINFGNIPGGKLGSSGCTNDPYKIRTSFNVGYSYISSPINFRPWYGFPNTYTCFSIVGASNQDEDFALRSNAQVTNPIFPLEISIPFTKSGMWQCDLLFAEIDITVRTSGIRVFDVQVQDQKLSNYDILEFTSNGTFTKHALTFVDIPVADILSIRLSPIQGKHPPAINGISCSLKKPMSRAAVTNLLAERQLAAGTKSKACVQRPEGSGFFFNAGGPKLCGIRGEPYSWILGGLNKSDPLRLTDDRAIRLARIRKLPEIYLNSRVGKPWYRGKWGYRIPVPIPGSYIIEFHFAELTAGIRKGDRVFNIEVLAEKHTRRLLNIDVFNSASYLSPHVTPVGPIKIHEYVHVYVQKTPSSKYGGLVSAIRVNMLKAHVN